MVILPLQIAFLIGMILHCVGLYMLWHGCDNNREIFLTTVMGFGGLLIQLCCAAFVYFNEGLFS